MTTFRNQQIRGFFVLGSLLTGALPGFCQQDPPAVPQPSVRFSLEGRFSLGGLHSITHSPIPLSFRQIPPNPGDPQSYQFTLPDSPFVSTLGYIHLAVLPGVSFKRFTVRGGPQFTPVVFTPGPVKDTTPNTKEINQVGTTERGYGTSLVYLNGKGARSSKLGFVGEGDVRIYKLLSVVGGYSVSNFDFYLASGYDRFNALQSLTQKLYSHDQVKGPYFGVRLNCDPGLEPFTCGFYLTASPVKVETTPLSGLGLTPYQHSSWSFEGSISAGYKRTKK